MERFTMLIISSINLAINHNCEKWQLSCHNIVPWDTICRIFPMNIRSDREMVELEEKRSQVIQRKFLLN